MAMLQVVSGTGTKFEVDTSDEACTEFGFKHGDKIIYNRLGYTGVVVGVAPSMYSDKVLWLAFNHDNGKVSHFDPLKDTDLSLQT